MNLMEFLRSLQTAAPGHFFTGMHRSEDESNGTQGKSADDLAAYRHDTLLRAGYLRESAITAQDPHVKARLETQAQDMEVLAARTAALLEVRLEQEAPARQQAKGVEAEWVQQFPLDIAGLSPVQIMRLSPSLVPDMRRRAGVTLVA